MSDENQRQQKSVPETPEELVSLAQEYFSHEFPTTGNRCPSPGEIARQIESEQLPDDALREHLLTCSSCFVTYKEHLQRSRDMQPVVVPLRRRISEFLRNPWLRVLVPSLPVLLLAVVAVFYFRAKNSQVNVTSVNSPVEVVNANANAAITTQPSPVQIDPSNQVERTTQVARVDLRKYSPQRGNETGEEPPPLQIEERPTAFTITMPEGSPPGIYTVSILDAFGKPIKTRTSRSVDGKRLTATLNLDNLRNQKYRLCVSRSDEPPNCYPIAITKRGK
jgi:hypothetical protein